MNYQWYLSFGVALVVGLLIGLDRERQHAGAAEPVAGLRTFALASVGGLVAVSAGGVPLLVAALVGVAVLVAIAYWTGNRSDPGLTTEIALVATVALGGLALVRPAEAAAAGVVIAILLAARTWLHGFARETLTGSEMRDGLVLAAATFIVLPLLPDTPVDPFNAINPRQIWTTAVLVMAISGAGYVAERMLGPRLGLAFTGLASGFVSSTATVGAMGSRARNNDNLAIPAATGAILSTVATAVQLAVVLAATSMPVALEMAAPLAVAGILALAYGVVLGRRAGHVDGSTAQLQRGRAFDFRTALIFSGTLAVVLLVTAVVGDRFGTAGLVATTALAGLVDVHSSAIAVASLVVSGRIAPADATLPILAAFVSNTVSKCVMAATAGTASFTLRVVPGLILVAAGFVAAALLL